jgi:hypothetical protein
MTQKPEAEEPERRSDVTRDGSPKIQPVLVGFVLATIIGMIMIAAFWGH